MNTLFRYLKGGIQLHQVYEFPIAGGGTSYLGPAGVAAGVVGKYGAENSASIQRAISDTWNSGGNLRALINNGVYNLLYGDKEAALKAQIVQNAEKQRAQEERQRYEQEQQAAIRRNMTQIKSSPDYAQRRMAAQQYMANKYGIDYMTRQEQPNATFQINGVPIQLNSYSDMLDFYTAYPQTSYRTYTDSPMSGVQYTVIGDHLYGDNVQQATPPSVPAKYRQENVSGSASSASAPNPNEDPNKKEGLMDKVKEKVQQGKQKLTGKVTEKVDKTRNVGKNIWRTVVPTRGYPGASNGRLIWNIGRDIGTSILGADFLLRLSGDFSENKTGSKFENTRNALIFEPGKRYSNIMKDTTQNEQNGQVVNQQEYPSAIISVQPGTVDSIPGYIDDID